MQHTIITPISYILILLDWSTKVILMGVGLIICSNDGSCKFCSQNLYRGECLGCLNGSYGPVREVVCAMM